MATQVNAQGVAETRNPKGTSTQSPTTTVQETLLRKDTICSVPEIKKGQNLTLDYGGDIQINCNTLGLSYKNLVTHIDTNDPSGTAARGVNAANARLAALLVKKKDIQLVEAPIEDFTKLVGNMTAPTSTPPPNVCPSGIMQLPQCLKKIAQYFSTEGAAAQAYKTKKIPLMAQQKIFSHNQNVQKQLTKIFDEITVTTKWGAQLASKVIMYTYRSKSQPQLTRQEVLQAFTETDGARFSNSLLT